MVEINNKAKKIDLFDGLNVHPVPLDFTNSLTTTEFLLALQNKVNELVERWNISFDNLKEYTKEEQLILKQEITEHINTIQSNIIEIINTLREETETTLSNDKQENKDYVDSVKNEILERVVSLESILNLINNGESIDLSALYNNYADINNRFSQIINDFERVQQKFTTLKNSVEEFTQNVAICEMLPQEEMEHPETLINDTIKSKVFTYSSDKIETLLKNVNTTINNISTTIQTVGNTNADNREQIENNINQLLNEINTIYDVIEQSEKRLVRYIEDVEKKLNDTIKQYHSNGGGVIG